jgi:hypothetical protein
MINSKKHVATNHFTLLKLIIYYSLLEIHGKMDNVLWLNCLAHLLLDSLCLSPYYNVYI